MKSQLDFDLLVMGGGPAGLTAAIYAARASLKTVVIEKNICGGLVNSTWNVENFPSQKSISGMALMEMITDQVRELGVHVEEVAQIDGLDLVGDIKRIVTEEGIYQAPAAILCPGRKPVELEIKTDCEQIHYCSVCDGANYKGKRVLVVGGGNSAFDESLHLLDLGIGHITLIEQMDRFFAADSTSDRLLSRNSVRALTNTRLKDLIVQDRLHSACLENTLTGKRDTMVVDGIFVFMGQKPNTDDLKDQIDLDENGYIRAGKSMETNLPGVYAGGDAVRKKYRQITTAMNDGTIAALEAAKFLSKRKVQRF